MDAMRAWGSNGLAFGETEEVDCKIAECRVQAKRRKTLPAYLQIPEGCDVVAFRQDRGDTMILMKWKDFLDILEEKGGW
jgi:hypothetical protein